MASAKDSRLPRKANRAVFERPEKKAAPRAFVDESGMRVRSPAPILKRKEDGLAGSRSTPEFFKFNPEEFTSSSQPKTRPVRKPNSPAFLSPPSPLTANSSTGDLQGLRFGGPSATDLLYDGEESPSSPVMGKNWKQMQEATFTNWINERLKGKQAGNSGLHVKQLGNDLRNGLVLIKLLEVLTKKKIEGYVRQPSLTAHKLVNLDLAFKLIAQENIKLIGIGSHNIFEGNLGLIMGLVWTLIQKYQIRMTSTRVSTKAVMINWLQSILPDWKISNLNTDWNDGRCLMALIREVKPGIGQDVRMLDPTKRRQNCSQALTVAATHLKIPKLIAPEDLSNPNIDDLSVMTYLSYFCDPAKQRLLKWVKRTIPQLKINNFGSDWSDGRAFAAIVDTCFSGLFPGWIELEAGKTKENMAAILPLVKRFLGVEATFTAAELARGETEELKVMTFVNLIRNASMLSLPNEIAVSGPGLQKAVVGKQTSFEIDTTQAGPGKLFIDAYYENGLKVTFHITEKLSGVITLRYTPEKCGVVNFDILWSDTPIPRSPFSVLVSDSQLVRIIDFDRHPTIVQVNQNLELLLNTRPAGTKGHVFARLEYDQKGVRPTEAQLTSYPDSTVKLTYKPTVAGKAILRIYWNDEELSHLTVTYTVIDNFQYKLIAKPEDKVYRTFQHANFQVKSEHGQLSALKMTANLEDQQIPISFTHVQGNVGHASFVPTQPGTYRIEVSCVEKLIEGTPFTINVADPSKCKLVSMLPEYLKLNSPNEIVVQTSEAGKGALEVSCPDRDISRNFDVQVRTLPSQDLQGVMVTPRRQGNYLLGITFFGGHIPSSPFRVTVVDPAQCSISGEVFKRGKCIVGKPVQFQITRTGGMSLDLRPQVKATGPSAKYTAEVSTSDNRTYFVQFTPWEIGMHEISITYGGFHVPRSPFRMGVQSFDSEICSATGSGLQRALSGIPAQFVILAKQPGLVESGILSVDIRNVTQPSVQCRVRIRDNQNGTYQVAYLVDLPGAYLINILAARSPIPGSPFRLTAKPGPDPSKCKMWGPAFDTNALLTIGQPIDFMVSTVDAGTGELTVKAVGPGGSHARVYLAKTDGKAGFHDVKLDPIRHGKYRVSVKWAGKHIPGSPKILKVYAGADASKCCAYGPGLEDGEVGRPSTFVIETRDAGAGTLKVRLHGVKNAFKIELAPKDQKDQRTLNARYDPQKPGEYLITIKWSDKNIPGSPFRVKIEGDHHDDDSGDEKTRATPIYHGLSPLMESDEDDVMVKSSETALRNKKRSKRKNKVKAGMVPGMPPGVMPVFVVNPYMSVDPSQMPRFQTGMGGAVPYQLAFTAMPQMQSGTKRKSNNKDGRSVTFNPHVGVSPINSSTQLHPMMTHDRLSMRVKKRKVVPANMVPDSGSSFRGHATMNINTISKKSTTNMKSIMKKSFSDSSASSARQ